MTDDILLGIANGSYSLHDSIVAELSIDLDQKEIILIVRLYLEKNKKIRILLHGLTKVEGKLTYSFKNEEVLLDCQFHSEHSLRIYASSDSFCLFEFHNATIEWYMPRE